MKVECLEITSSETEIRIESEGDAVMRNFFYMNENIKNMLDKNKYVVIMFHNVSYCNSSFISFLVSTIGHITRMGIDYEITVSAYLEKILEDLNVWTFFKNKIIRESNTKTMY